MHNSGDFMQPRFLLLLFNDSPEKSIKTRRKSHGNNDEGKFRSVSIVNRGVESCRYV